MRVTEKPPSYCVFLFESIISAPEPQRERDRDREKERVQEDN